MSDGGGWGWPQASKKAHYFVGGRSLCGKWLYMGPADGKQLGFQGADDCTACYKKVKPPTPDVTKGGT